MPEKPDAADVSVFQIHRLGLRCFTESRSNASVDEVIIVRTRSVGENAGPFLDREQERGQQNL